jgi:HSP20 family protein
MERSLEQMTTNTQPGTAITRRPEGGLAHRSPWEELNDLRLHMDDLFSRAFGYTPLSRLIPGNVGEFEPPFDIYETEDKVVAMIGLPGYTPKDINLEMSPDSFTVTGERKALFEDPKATAYRKSWLASAGNFSISHTVPSEIDPNRVKAVFNNGVLQIEMPKTEQARAKTVKVNVQG